VILDVEMPELDGVEATRQIRRALPDTEVLIFTLQDAEWLIADVLRAGARGYLRKTESEQRLIDAVEALARHAPFFSANVVEMLLRHLLKSGAESAENPILTTRETEIVRLLAEGKSNKQIGTSLQISVKTVETHRAAIMRKLRFKSIVDLVRYAIRNNLIRP